MFASIVVIHAGYSAFGYTRCCIGKVYSYEQATIRIGVVDSNPDFGLFQLEYERTAYFQNSRPDYGHSVPHQLGCN